MIDFDWCNSGLAECPDDTKCINEDLSIYKCKCKEGLIKIGNYLEAEHIEKCWSQVLLIIILVSAGICFLVLIGIVVFISVMYWKKKQMHSINLENEESLEKREEGDFELISQNVASGELYRVQEDKPMKEAKETEETNL